MAKIINENQQIIIGTLFPRGVNSRVISCLRPVPPGPAHVFAFTERVGQSVHLLSVRVWAWPGAPDVTFQTNFRLFTGTSDITTANDMLQWDEIVPVMLGAGQPVGWTHYGGGPVFEWYMNKLYTGLGRRFGFRATHSAVGSDQLHASFQISEG